MDKRLLLAVTLSILVMLLYPFFLAKITPPSPQEIPLKPIEEKPVVKQRKVSEERLPEDAYSIFVNTERYEMELSEIGGSIKFFSIRDSKKLDVDLVENAIYDRGLLALDGKDALEGLSSQPFQIKEDTNTLYFENEVFKIEKSLSFLEGKYGFVSRIEIENISDSFQDLQFRITTASNISDKEIYESRYIGGLILYKSGHLKWISGRSLKKYREFYEGDVAWLCLKNKYYSIIAEPAFDVKGVFGKTVDRRAVVGFIVDDGRIAPGEKKIYNVLFYIGPTELKELEKVDHSFSKALNFGMFTSISLILLSILKFFYGIFHNYGVSILLLTCCISLILFPLSLKSLSSMRRLQELQPQIEKIRSEYKDNPRKLNKEIMEIYRRYKVNPMSGCFPMLLQMPIFIALYQTLSRSVELKGSGFLWIKDLSMPDAAFRLPFGLPILGNTINLLPILMIGAMIIQQKISQLKTGVAQTEQQKMMGSVMPIIFGFIFYSLPSGLVLYWLTNTIITGTFQYIMLRKT